jgi:hypothetical protein
MCGITGRAPLARVKGLMPPIGIATHPFDSGTPRA